MKGHGGEKVAKRLKELLHVKLLQKMEQHPDDMQLALKESFLETDKILEEEYKTLGERCGATAAVALIAKNPKAQKTLYCANIGDARVVLWYFFLCPFFLELMSWKSRNGKAMRLTKDHKALDPGSLSIKKDVLVLKCHFRGEEESVGHGRSSLPF